MLDFVEYCKNFILEHIDGYADTTHYACDFCTTITEGPNVDGTLTYSRQKAIEYLCEWWEDASEYWEYEKQNFGENLHNPFENPEAYMVCMVIEGVSYIMGQCPVISDNWDDEIVITEDVIAQIKSFVEDFSEVSLF